MTARDAAALDARFREAVAAIDAGDVARLERTLAAHPALVRERLESPGAWLRDQVGGALDGFFARPYLLWFVAEDPVRRDTMAPNVADIATAIVRAMDRELPPSRQEQLDYALRLVAWSWVAARCGVQRALVDVLADAGASLDGRPEDALVNGNADGAAHMVARGAPLTLATALYLGRLDDARRLGALADDAQRQHALVLCALGGRADGVRAALAMGADPSRRSEDLYSHATPLHHAVCSGSLATVQALVDAGARLDARDTVHEGTPLGWAEYYQASQPAAPRAAEYAEIAECLRRAGQSARVDGRA